jgi:hypothetical protein
MTFADLNQVLIGPDVSNVNGRALNLSILQQQNIGFGIYKCGQGLITGNGRVSFNPDGSDILARANDAVLKALGVPRARYFFMEKGNGAAQAERFWAITQLLGDVNLVGHCIDVETQDARGNGPSWQDVLDFLARWQQLTDRPLGIYSGRWYMNGYLHNPTLPANGFSWVWDGGTYVSNENCTADPWQVLQSGGRDQQGVTPGYWNAWGGSKSYDLRQYKSTVSIGGIQPCDVSVFPGTRMALEALWGIESTTSQTEPAPPVVVPVSDPTPPAPVPVPAPSPTTWSVNVQNLDLRNADKTPVHDNGSNGVKALQAMLQAAGFDCGCKNGVPDGIAGVKTHASLGAFQTAHNLGTDYIAGQKTFDALVAL